MTTGIHTSRLALVASSFLLFLGISGTGTGPESNRTSPKSGQQPSRVILITVDTLRHDRLECYGYSQSRTPNINRLAADGVRFSNAICQVPLTLPSHCSILTGTHPVFHGVRDQASPLSPQHQTLAELLKAQGFSTAAFVSTFVLSSRFGLSQGFDSYDDTCDRDNGLSADGLERRGDRTLLRALEWMEKPANSRFFAWLHLYDPHTPYTPPEPYGRRYAARPYDGEIAFVDSLLGELIRFLEKKGWYSQTLLVLAADHGEDLGDHGEYTHGFFVYDSTMRIPLIIKTSGGKFAGKVVADAVESVDIAPTILQLLSLQGGPGMQGKGLFSPGAHGLGRPEAGLGETYYPFHHFGWSPLRFLRTERFKYVEAPKPELYDLQLDPGERTNLAGTRQTVVTELRGQLFERLGRFAASNTTSVATRDVDIATLQKLRSLGYVGYRLRPGTTETAAYSKFPDPKERLAVYNRYQAALQEEENGRIQEALRKYQELLRTDPSLIDAHIHLGLCYKRLGQYPKAIEQFKKVALLAPESSMVSYNLAHSYALAGKTDEAVAGFRRTLQLDPLESRAHTGLGIAYQLRGQLEQALIAYQRALEINPSDATALSNLGAAELSKRDIDKAIGYLRRALEINPNNAETCNTLGSALLMKGSLAEAVTNLRRAIQLNSNYADAHVNLGLALMKAGDFPQAAESFKRALAINPSSGPTHRLLAEAYASQGMQRAAEAEVQKAKTLEVR
jgi:arylsulfatase A-like enzyme/tetratricopeptide (TPR) repeat protein